MAGILVAQHECDLFANRIFTDETKYNKGWSLIQYTWCPSEHEKVGAVTDIHRRGHQFKDEGMHSDTSIRNTKH